MPKAAPACSIAGSLWLLASFQSFAICRTCQRSQGVCWRHTHTDFSIRQHPSQIESDRVRNKDNLINFSSSTLQTTIRDGLSYDWISECLLSALQGWKDRLINASDWSSARLWKKPDISRGPSTCEVRHQTRDHNQLWLCQNHPEGSPEAASTTTPAAAPASKAATSGVRKCQNMWA